METLIRVAPDFAHAHTCQHCAKLIIPMNDMYTRNTYVKTVATFDDIADLYDLFIDGCLLLYLLFIKSIGQGNIPSKVDIGVTGGSLQNFITKWGQGQPIVEIETTTSSYNEKLVIKLRWTYGGEPPSSPTLKNVEIDFDAHALGDGMISLTSS